jgi:hypothetical protein
MSIIERFRPRGASFFGRGHNTEGIDNLPEFLAARDMAYGVKKVQVSIPGWHLRGRTPHLGSTTVENQFVIRRDSDQAVVSPMTVSRQYGEISPMDMAKDLTPFVEQGLAFPDSAFKIRQGCVENVEAIALRLDLGTDDPFQDGLGEVYRAYLVARNYHGRGSAAAMLFLEREVSSSLMTAIANVSGFTIVHRGDVRDKYALSMKRWAELRKLMQTLANRLGTLGTVAMSFRQAEMFVDELLQIKPGEELKTQKKNLRAAFMDAFNMPRFGTFGRTAADMYHGVTWVGSHYTSAKSKLDADDIMVGLLEGTRGSREKRAMTLLDTFVANNTGR